MKIIDFKRYCAAVLALMMLLLPVGVAEDGQPAADVRVKIQDVQVNESGELDVLFFSDGGSDTKTIAASIDGTEIPMDTLQTYDAGTSYIFLVDTASVSTRSGQEPIRATLLGLIAMVGKGDNASILSSGSDMSSIELVENTATLEAMIDSLIMDPTEVRLYDTISASLNYLKSSEDARPHKVLVVLSDGETTSEQGTSAVDAMALASENSTTIYAVAYTNKSFSSEELSTYALLAKFSLGGQPILTSKRAESADTVLNTITQNEKFFYTMHCMPAEAEVNGRELTVHIDDASGSYLLSDEIRAAIDEAIAANSPSEETTAPEEETEPEVEETEAEEADEADDGEGDTDWTTYIIIGVCAAVLIVAIIVAVVLKKRKKAAEAEEESSRAASPAFGETMPLINREAAPAAPVKPATPRVQVTLTPQNGQASYASLEGGELIVGRDPARAKLLLKDPKISGTHLRLRYTDGVLIAEDVSRNGTSVNGVRIQRPTVLNQHDTLTMGTTKFQITWLVK